MNNSEPPRKPYPLRARPHNLSSWIKSRQHRKEKEKKKQFMKTVIARCHFCDCEYDTRRYSKCYKCGAVEGDLSIGQKLRQLVRKFWLWFQ